MNMTKNVAISVVHTEEMFLNGSAIDGMRGI